ncbi:MAG: hypothetical protein MUF43_13395 [Flavobacterium sp.]|jgi:hypothetical protein|nr:hypothetical protein [Flavobacterium sp.]
MKTFKKFRLRHVLILTIFISAFSILLSCKENITNVPPSENKLLGSKIEVSKVREQSSELKDGFIELGEKLDNPYSIQNMEKALKDLRKTNPNFENLKIENNYNYVRIEAETEEAQWDIEAKDDIDLYNYPLDYKVIKSGNKYKEKDIDSKFQVYWAAVPVDYIFPKDLKVKVIEKLFLPFGNGKKNENLQEQEKEKLLLLESTSLNLTGNKVTQNKNLKTSFYPSGYIRVFDDITNTNLPIEGVTVKGKRWFTTRTVVTDASGYYYMNHDFNGPVDYTIIWEQYDFDIRDGSYGQALSGYNNLSTGYSVNITLSGSPDSFRWAHAFRAAYTYYYKNTQWGIKTPPKKGSPIVGNNGKMKIGVRVGGTSHFFDWNSSFLSAQVMISVGNNNSRWIFGTTIHELGHASHWELGFGSFDWLNSTNKKLTESWSTGLEWRITNDVYNSLLGPPFISNYMDDFQLYTLAQMPSVTYTPLFIDLMDGENQFITRGNTRPNDTANGFTLQMLESKLTQNPKNWDNLRNSLMTMTWVTPSASTQYLFDNYK